MELIREVQVQSLAVVFAGMRLVGKVPQMLKFRQTGGGPSSVRECPPECLTDPMLGRHMYLKINDTKYHYVESGSRRNQMVLCLHDFTDFWYGWRKQLRALSGFSWVIALDLKGFGDSEKPYLASNYKDDIILEDLKKLVNVLQEAERKIVIMGHGLGGYIAWKFIEKYPDMIDKFISISTPHPRVWLKSIMRTWRSIYEHRWLYFCRLPLLPEKEMLQNDLEIFDKRFKKSNSVMDLSAYSNFDKEAYKYTFSRRQDWQGPVNYYRNLPLNDISLLKSCDENSVLPVDCLFLVGNMDPDVSLEMVSQSAEYVARFAVQIINMAGNAVHQEQPDVTNKYISRFIKGCEGEGENQSSEEYSSELPDLLKIPDSRLALLSSYATPLKSRLSGITGSISSLTSVTSTVTSAVTPTSFRSLYNFLPSFR